MMSQREVVPQPGLCPCPSAMCLFQPLTLYAKCVEGPTDCHTQWETVNRGFNITLSGKLGEGFLMSFIISVAFAGVARFKR